MDNLRRYIYNKLISAGVDENEISAETNFILTNAFKIKNPYLELDLSVDDLNKIENICRKREQGIPLQYILGIADFMGEQFVVDNSTLIPRQETELLVNQVLKISSGFLQPKIFDIGTGSGCISIMLAKALPDAQFCASDISAKALNVAEKNAKNHNVNITFVNSDIFNNIEDKFDIIVSNPPYIPLSEKLTIQKEVSFEPDSALYTNDKNGVEFYEKILREAKNYINKGGFLVFELGINQSYIVKKFFIDYNYSQIEVQKDLNGIDRVISAKV